MWSRWPERHASDAVPAESCCVFSQKRMTPSAAGHVSFRHSATATSRLEVAAEDADSARIHGWGSAISCRMVASRLSGIDGVVRTERGKPVAGDLSGMANQSEPIPDDAL